MSGNQQRGWSDDDLNLTGAICSSTQRVFERVHARVDRMRVWGRDTDQLSDCEHRRSIPGVARLGLVVHRRSTGLRLSWVALMGVCEDWAVAHGYDRVTLCAYRDVPWKPPCYKRLGWHGLSEGELEPELRGLRLQEREPGLEIQLRLAKMKRLSTSH